MIREAPTQNRYVQEAENERQYQKHVNAIKNMKPSINTHAEIKNKDKKSRNPRVRIFNGQAALNNGNQQMASTGPKKEKIIDKNERRPRSGMNYINLEIDIENDNENEVFNNKKHRKANMDLISISESGSGPLDSSKKKDGIDNSNSPDKKDITDFDIFSMNSAKSQAEKEREEITTNRYHPYIPSNSARTKVKTIKPEVQQQPLSAKKSRIPLSRQDNNHNNGNNATPPGLKKTSSNGSIPKTNVPNTKPKIKVKPKTERSNTNNDDTDNTPNNNVSFNAPKVSSARRKTKNDNNHPHMNQMDKQQMQAQQRQQQRILKQQQEKIERQERLEKLEKQKKKISAAPSSPQMPSSPSTPINNKSSGAKQTGSSNLGSSSSLSNKKQSSENKKAKNENNDRKLFKTEISLSKTKTQNEKRMCETDLDANNSNSDSFLPCQPVFTEPTPKVTFGADMWDTSDDEDDDDDEIENIIKDQNEENIDDDDVDIDEINNINSSSDANDTNEKSFISDIDSERDGIRDDFVCSDDFSSDNDF